MNIQINGLNLEITPKVKKIIDNQFCQKIDRLLQKYNEEIKTAFMHLKQDKYNQYIISFDITLPGKNGHIYAKHLHKNLIAAITGLREQIEKQIKKYKDSHMGYSLG